MNNRRKWSLIYIPDHQGVLNVGGRIGARLGPEAHQKAVKSFSGDKTWLGVDLNQTLWLENIGADVNKNLQRASTLIEDSHKHTHLSVVVGGGHDHGYSQLKGVNGALGGGRALGCINLDAHFDLRRPNPTITSGSGFYLALEQGLIEPKNFVEFGIQLHCNSPELWKYAEKKKIQIHTLPSLIDSTEGVVGEFKKTLKSLSQSCDEIVLSFDLDCVQSASAPGVSSPQVEGFSPSEALAMIRLAAKEPKVTSLGIFELNPIHDEENRTAQLAAVATFQFIEQKFRT